MWKVTIKGLLAHKLRLALTALAIVLGVTFISGTFVLTDTLHNTFNTLFGHIYQNVDFEVRGKAAFTGNSGEVGAVRKPIPQSIATTVRHIPGVAYAEGTVTGYAQFVAPDGKAITTGGAPTLGLSFDPNPQLSSLQLVQGTAPTTPHDVVDGRRDGAEVPLRRRATGCASSCRAAPDLHHQRDRAFGTANNLAGATIAAFDLPTAQRLFGEVGRYDAIDVLAQPGADKADRRNTPSPRVLPPGVEVVTGQTVANEQTNDINQALSFFSTALLVFAFISLFVGGFTIFNTFSITVGQRTARAGPAAHRGGQPTPGVPLRAGRGGHPRARGVARRPGARRAGRPRARGAAQGVRHHPAVGAPRLRDPHRHRRPRRGRGGDRGLGHQPGPARRAHPPGGRAGRPPGRRAGVVRGAGSRSGR